MTTPRGSTPTYTEELTVLLHRTMEQVVFEVPGFGNLKVPQFRQLYDQTNDLNTWLSVYASQPQLEDNLLTQLTSFLRSLLSAWIVDDHIGNGLCFLMGGASELEFIRFTSGLIRMAAILGPARSAGALCEWAKGEPVHYRSCAILYGSTLDEPLVMNDGIVFEKLSTFPEAASASHLPSPLHLEFNHFEPMGASKVTFDCIASPVFSQPGERAPTYERTRAFNVTPRDFAYIICEALSLMFNHYVSWSMLWSECEDLQVLGMLTGPTSSRRLANHVFWHGPKISPEHLVEVLELIIKRIDCQNSNQRLDRAIRRWMGSKRNGDLADQFIELRIALEALYNKKSTSGSGFRVASHGAWHLGSDFKERRQYQEALRKAYKLASGAVHASEVLDNKNNRDVLTEGQDLCRLGILKRLNESEEPNWDDMILGKSE